ncbi:hypothetical protein K3495_g9099 [Podosphaera aphanis]|nr:hypothetical protein K3495_g9099 [Podosphaera aphanis]
MVRFLDSTEHYGILLNFTVCNDKLHLIRRNASYSPGKPPSTSCTATLLEVLEYDDLLISSIKIHENLRHTSAGTTMREISRQYWHPELKLAIYAAIRKCQSCQLMKPPDPTLGDLTSIQPAPPLTRWAIDNTQIGPKILLNAVEYATGWLE